MISWVEAAGHTFLRTQTVDGFGHSSQEADMDGRHVPEIKALAHSAGYQIFFGAPTALSLDGKSNNGRRVAILVKGKAKAEIITDKADKHINLLALSGRWLEVCVPVGDGKQQIIVSTLYGISGASNDTTKRDETERLLAAALLRKAQLKNVPYFITTDLNIDPRKMKVLENAINQELCYDSSAISRNFCQSTMPE